MRLRVPLQHVHSTCEIPQSENKLSEIAFDCETLAFPPPFCLNSASNFLIYYSHSITPTQSSRRLIFMCSFCFHSFEIVTVIERDADRRQAEHIHMLSSFRLANTRWMRLSKCSESALRINARILLNHSLEDIWPAKQLQFHSCLPLGNNELSCKVERRKNTKCRTSRRKRRLW